MKGPNPFAPWETDPENVCGRKDESRIFNGFADSVSSKQAGALLVAGGPGGGKSTILRFFRSEAEKNGILCLSVKGEKGEDERAIVDKINAELAYSQPAPIRRESHKSEAAPATLEKLLEMIEKAERKAFGVIIFIDDIDRMRKGTKFISKIAALSKTNWGKRTVGFVLSSTSGASPSSELITYMQLQPFEMKQAAELMEKSLGKGPPKMGEECLASIVADTGGNPMMIKSVCRHIYEKLRDNEKVITKGHYLGYMQYIMSMLSREWFGRMYQETPESERGILRQLAKNEDGMHVSDIAKGLGKPLGPITALTKRLLERGQIVRLDRGKYRIFARLYARYVNQRII